ncbi:MAG: serine--tRNA ligase, partial [Halobacteriaceae archaeon]
MLSRAYIREHTEEVRETLQARGADDVDLEHILELDEEWRELKSKGDTLRHERNEISDKIGELKAEGKEEEAKEAIDRSQQLKEQIQDIENRADTLDKELTERLLRVPQTLHESVPEGADEGDNVERRREGFEDTRQLPASITPHYELGAELEILDEERGAKTTGSGFYFLKGEGAQIEHALIQFMLDLHREQGYSDIFPPIPVNSKSMTGTGQLPKFDEDAYKIEDEDLWLCPTAEVPLTNMYADDILLADELPIKHQAYTP